jgi:hypothetical protein
MVESIEKFKLSKMLNMKLTGLAYRKTCGDLMDKSFVHEEENIIELKIRPGESLWINEKVVQHVLDLPCGTAKKSEASMEDVDKEYDDMFVAFRVVSKKYSEDSSRRGIKRDNEGQQQPPSNEGQ